MTVAVLSRWLEEGRADLRKEEVGPDQYFETIILYNENEVEITKVCNILRVRLAKRDWAKGAALLFLEKNDWIKIGHKGRYLKFGGISGFHVIDHGYYLEWLFEISYWNENTKDYDFLQKEAETV